MDLKTYVPQGVQDFLPQECYNKRKIENKLRERFMKCGYFEIETPTFEFYDVFSSGAGSVRQEKMIKFFDDKGRILSLRPDITMPIARVVATKMPEIPSRVCYVGNAFGYDNSTYGTQREFTQAGVECFGVVGAIADAEIIATAIDSLRDIGLENFLIDIGQVEFFKGLMEEAGLSAKESDDIHVFIEKKDMLSLELLLKHKPLSNRLKKCIMELTTLYGGFDVLNRAYNMSSHPRCRSAVDHLKEVCDILKKCGYGDYLSIDLGMLKSFNYYTGIIFRGITEDLSFSLLAGGRYDTLIESFGKSVCAMGFAIGIKRVMIALERQNKLCEIPLLDAVVSTGGDINLCFKYIGQLRESGYRVENALCMPEHQLVEYARGKALCAVYITASNEMIRHDFAGGEKA